MEQEWDKIKSSIEAIQQHDEIPYTLKAGGREITVLSYNNFVNDYTTFRAEGRAPREVPQMWKDWFDYVYTEGREDCYEEV